MKNLFSSVRILDLTRVFSGPFATRHFADFGAEVIKVECPGQGDDSRGFPLLKDNWSAYFENLNRNKKSIVLDLKNPQHVEHFYRLCKDADVVVENFTPSVKEKLKIDYETLKTYNPKIIYASLFGVSEKDPRPYYDVIAQAESGLASLNGETEDMKVSTSIVDAFSGLKLAYAIAAALFGREKTGTGTHLKISMKGSAFDLLEQNLIAYSQEKKNPAKVGNMDNVVAPFGLFKAQDGTFAIAIVTSKQWEKLAVYLQERRPSLPLEKFSTNDDRLASLVLLTAELNSVFATMTVTQIVADLRALGIPSGPANTMRDVFEDNENYTAGLLQKEIHPQVGEIAMAEGGITFSEYQREKYQPAPTLGQDNEKYAV